MYIQVAYIRWRLESVQDLNFKNGIQTKIQLWSLMKKKIYIFMPIKIGHNQIE